MRLILSAVAIAAIIALAGCDESDLASHIQGGISIAVDPVTGAITPNIGVNIKDSRGVTMLHVAAGTPISKELARKIYVQTNNKYRVVRSETRDIVSQSDPCEPVRAVSETIDETVEITVTPSMREQLRNIVLLRERKYIRNTRPVERVIEKVEKQYCIAEVVSLQSTTATEPAIVVIPANTNSDGSFSIPGEKGLFRVEHQCQIINGKRVCK